MTAATQTGAAATRPGSSPAPAEWIDPREQIEIGVLMANGRLAPRHFASRSEAEAWAIDGEQVVEYNNICSCDT